MSLVHNRNEVHVKKMKQEELINNVCIVEEYKRLAILKFCNLTDTKNFNELSKLNDLKELGRHFVIVKCKHLFKLFYFNC